MGVEENCTIVTFAIAEENRGERVEDRVVKLYYRVHDRAYGVHFDFDRQIIAVVVLVLVEQANDDRSRLLTGVKIRL